MQNPNYSVGIHKNPNHSVHVLMENPNHSVHVLMECKICVHILIQFIRTIPPHSLFILLFHTGRVTTYHNSVNCGPKLPNPPCQLSLREETGVPGEHIFPTFCKVLTYTLFT